MSDTPLTDAVGAQIARLDSWPEALELMEEHAETMELDRAVLLEALKNAADYLNKLGHTVQAEMAYIWIEQVLMRPFLEVS